MPLFRMYDVVVVFSDGSFAQRLVNCSNSMEAIKGTLGHPEVVAKMGSNKSATRNDIVEVKCKLDREWEA